MKWPEFFLRHRYTVFALIIAIVVSGVYAKQNMEVSLFPDTSPPTINVITPYPGASPGDVSKDVIEPLEEEFAALENVNKVKSTAQDGLSVIKVEFNYGSDPDISAVEVQNAISRAKRELPSDIPQSRVLEFNTSSHPVITYGLSSEKINLPEVRSIASEEIKNRLQLIDGVAAVDVFGGYQKQINVKLERQRLEANGISTEQVAGAIKKKNISGSAGTVNFEDEKYTIRIAEQFASVEEIKKTVITAERGSLVRVEDVAVVEDSIKDRNSSYKINGEENLALYVIKEDGANTVKVVNAVQEKVKELEEDYPYLEFTEADNEATFTSQVVNGMTGSIGYALLLTVIVILLFIVSLSESLVVALSMPLTFLSTLGLMQIFNKDLNMITMSALILSIGIVIDNSIVVVESISRHKEKYGKEYYRAAVDGTVEIMLPLFAGSITTVAVMIPLLFQEGFVGQTFGPLSETLIMAIISSLFISLTIIPLFVVMIRGQTWPGGEKMIGVLSAPFRNGIYKLKNFYLNVLEKAIKRRTVTLVCALAILVIGMRLISGLGMEVLPKMDTGTFFITLETHSGSTLQKTADKVSQVEALLEKEDEVISYNTRLGYETGSSYLGESGVMDTNQAYITVNLSSRKERQESIWDIQERLRQKIALLSGINNFVVKEEGSTAVATTAAPIVIRISGEDPEVLDHLSGQVLSEIKDVPGAVNLRKSWTLHRPEIEIKVDQERASQLGVTPAEVKEQVFSAVEGMNVTEVKDEDAEVNVRYQEQYRGMPEDLQDLRLSSPLDVQVPLKQVATLEETSGPDLVTREDMRRTIEVLGNTYNRPFSHVMNDVEERVQGVPQLEGYSIDITGERSDLADSRADLLSALIAAVIGVYIILMMQFKSFLHPFTIMLAIPLVLIGVALALLITGKSVSMPVLLGLILLAGTVVNNSILLIDYIVKARREGQERKEAVMSAVSVRYRPIMMTALSDVAGMLPLALELSLGSERFSPLATAVIGGILASTLLTMIVIPVVYTLFDDLKNLFQKQVSGNHL